MFEDFLAMSVPPFLNYTDFSALIIHQLPFDPSIHLHKNIFSHIIHPYNIEAFDHSLQKHNLLQHYPLLVNNLRHGFPLGFMPKIDKTIIIPNNNSFMDHHNEILDYLHKEVLSGHLSGPFSQLKVERTL